MRAEGSKLDRKQDAAIAALLVERTHADAARKAGIGEATLQRWLLLPEFRRAYRTARLAVVEAAIGRIQGATGHAVDTLVAVATGGAKEGDRVRAAVALLDHAFRGLNEAEVLRGDQGPDDDTPMGTADVVKVLSARLRQVGQSELPAGEKSRLTAGLADGLLRAIGVDVLDRRLKALEDVLAARRGPG